MKLSAPSKLVHAAIHESGIQSSQIIGMKGKKKRYGSRKKFLVLVGEKRVVLGRAELHRV